MCRLSVSVLDLGLLFVTTSLETGWTVERTLYGATSGRQEEYSGGGYRVETGITYSRLFPDVMGNLSGEVSLRMGLYFQKHSTDIPGESGEFDRKLISEQKGVTAALAFSLSSPLPNRKGAVK